MTKNSKARLTYGSVPRGLFRLTLPMILGISSNLIASLVEIWYLGQLGTKELAALSFTFPITSALMSVVLGISIGLSSVLARAVGGGDQTQIRALATDGIVLITLAMICLAALGFLSMELLFSLMGADPEILPMITQYMQIWFLGATFMAVSSVGANALRATGDAKISGTVMVSGAVLQMLFAPLFIFGLMGLPALGMPGAAVAMALSRLILFLITVYILYFREKLLDFLNINLSRLVGSWKKILVVGMPAIATQLIVPVSSAIIISMLATFGLEAVAGFGIASRIEGLSVIPLFALSATIGPFVGQNWGAEKFERANQAMKLSFLWSVCWGILTASLFFFFADPLILLFDDNQRVVETARLYLLIVPISYGAWGVLMMCSAIFNSLGKPISSTILSIIRMFVIYVPLAMLGQSLFGLTGIFAAACLSNLLMGLGAFSWNRKTYAS